MTSTTRELLTASTVELAKRIRRGEVSSREVVEAHIAHVERVDPDINAVAEERFVAATHEAERADADLRRRRSFEPGPLHGVPCSIKEAFALEGMPNTSGLLARRHVRTKRGADATAVARLRAAGAIPLAVTNVPELCMWIETDNCIYGRTNNPYDPDRIAGGSSGGEGAVVAAGGTPFGLGSDVGGSIRLPAFFNGVFGHKPSPGVVPNTGQYPLPAESAMRLLGTGPIARRAADLFPLLRILAGPDGRDGGVTDTRLVDPASVRLDRIRVLSVPDDGRNVIDADLREAQARAASHLADQGAAVETDRIPGMDRAFDVWAAAMSGHGGPTFGELLGDGTAVRPMRELVRYAMRPSQFTLPSILLAILEGATRLAPARTRRFARQGIALRERVYRLVGRDGVLLFPTFPRTAPRHREPLLRPFDPGLTAVFNALEMPVTQVPLGLNGRGLPTGVQVIAGPGNDHLTLAVALELERAFGGWVPPPRIFGTVPRRRGRRSPSPRGPLDNPQRAG